MKNPRRVMAGKLAYERKKAAQDEADKPAMKVIQAIVTFVLIIGMFMAFAK